MRYSDHEQWQMDIKSGEELDRHAERKAGMKIKAALVERFNREHPVGSRVLIWKGRVNDGPGIETTVDAPGAFILGGHTPVVKVPGDSIALTHVRAV